MTEATASHFAMFRGAIALVWADHKIESGEREQMLRFIENNTQLSNAQRAQLARDLEVPITLDKVWADITDKHDRAHLLNIAPIICHSDNEFCASEQAVYQRMYDDHMASIDQHATEHEIMHMAEEFRSQVSMDTQIRAEIRAKNPVGKLLTYLERLF